MQTVLPTFPPRSCFLYLFALAVPLFLSPATSFPSFALLNCRVQNWIQQSGSSLTSAKLNRTITFYFHMCFLQTHPVCDRWQLFMPSSYLSTTFLCIYLMDNWSIATSNQEEKSFLILKLIKWLRVSKSPCVPTPSRLSIIPAVYYGECKKAVQRSLFTRALWWVKESSWQATYAHGSDVLQSCFMSHLLCMKFLGSSSTTKLLLLFYMFQCLKIYRLKI